MAEHAETVQPNVEPFEGSCDCCAEAPKRIVHVDQDTSAYICEDCYGNHVDAIFAAAQALLAHYQQPEVAWEEIAGIAVKAYLEYEHFDGSGGADE